MDDFTYNLSTDIGKVRRDIGDKVQSMANFSDAEIQSFLEEGGSVKAAAGLALLAWGAALSVEDEKVSLGSWEGDRGDVCKKMSDLAERYLKLAGYVGTSARPSFRTAPSDRTPWVQADRELRETL